MTPRIITYFLCGMRHPTTGLSEDDLSRLTGSSSSSASCCSNGSSSSSSPSTSPLHKEQQQQQQSSNNGSIGDQQLTTPLNGSSSTALDAELLKNLKNSSTHAHTQQQQQSNNNGNGHNNKAGSHFNSSYLPEFIDPLDWQRSRKRKERLDSTSSTTQDRKLIRSNSEELLPNDDNRGQQTENREAGGGGGGDAVESTSTAANSAALKLKQHADAIRRVASEDFKKSPYCLFDQRAESADGAVLDPAAKERAAAAAAANINGSDENNAFAANRQQQHEPLPAAHNENIPSGGTTKDMTRRSRFETSPARSHRHSPNRNGNSNKHHRDSDDSECEHERRRSSERFCKSRAPPGRKAAGVMKKSGKYLPTKMRGDENAYKYDLSALKYERRGFNSKKPTVGERPGGSDYNDNNLIDFHIIRNGSETQQVSNNCVKSQPAGSVADSQLPAATSQAVSNNLTNGGAILPNNSGSHSNKAGITSAEALPWDSSTAADPTEPILSRRYATVRHRPLDCIDTAAKLSKVMPYPQQFHKQAGTQLMDDDDCEPLNAFRAFASLENLKTRDVMQQVIPAMMSFQSPEERLKQVNKRLTALKKKLTQFEQVFETKMGYRPSQAEKLNDKYMKNVLAEIGKLRKEKHELKINPMGVALGVKVCGDMDATKKLEKMKTSLSEIEQNLSEKRQESNRSQALEELTADQLLQEKTAVQHGLLYFESLYGRPSTKEERDAARPVYERYRQLKRMVSRSVTLAGAAAGAPELPTILEHEAMVFESTPQQYSSNTSTDSSNNTGSSSETLANASTDPSDDSTTTTTGTVEANSGVAAANATPPQRIYGENISSLSIEQLWEQFDKTCEEKKMLKRIIREYETAFEEQNGRKMLKGDRKNIEETYALYKEKKAKTRLLQALIKKHVSR